MKVACAECMKMCSFEGKSSRLKKEGMELIHILLYIIIRSKPRRVNCACSQWFTTEIQHCMIVKCSRALLECSLPPRPPNINNIDT